MNGVSVCVFPQPINTHESSMNTAWGQGYQERNWKIRLESQNMKMKTMVVSGLDSSSEAQAARTNALHPNMTTQAELYCRSEHVITIRSSNPDYGIILLACDLNSLMQVKYNEAHV